MMTLALIGLVGGLITGISPCILPVLPVIFFDGARSARDGDDATTARPYLVIAGLVLSFSAVTLIGSSLLTLLHLPQDVLRWVALTALVAIGLGLIFPGVETLLEKPFARIPQRQIAVRSNGFGLGLALGALYVPCAGPVLAAIVVAGATGNIGLHTVVLTLAFAVGATVPLLFFALAGRRVSERVGAFRRHQREIRVAAGAVTLLLAVALVFNLPAVLQRTIPDYTAALQNGAGGERQLQQLDLGGLVNDQNAQLSKCSEGARQLENCGPAPDIRGTTGWLNTPGNAPLDLKALRGNVVLVDFWAYSCINCQRAAPHVVSWYNTYHADGFEVIGVHTPEYAFEKVPGNVIAGAKDLGITYPVALDNNFSTWTNYRNRYWPAEYLIDAAGTVRHIAFGEGDYDSTETLIRQLLSAAKPGVKLPLPTQTIDDTPRSELTPETYLSVGKAQNYGGGDQYDQGSRTFRYPAALSPDSFALDGPWTLDYQGATAQTRDSMIALNYHAKNVYLLVGGTGTVTVTRAGHRVDIPISGPPTVHQVAEGDTASDGHLDVRVDQGLQVFSFTYG